MMNFRKIKSFIQETLTNNSNNCFRVVGAQKQTKNASETLGNDRLIEVFYSNGDFPKQASAYTGKVNHECTFRIELTVSATATIDLAVLEDPNAGAFARKGALETLKEASAVADDSLDELAELVYQVLEDARNIDMGLDVGQVTNRWIGSIQKDNPEPIGELLVLTGSMFLTLRTIEEIVGVSATASGDIQNVTIDIDGDDVGKTGAEVNS